MKIIKTASGKKTIKLSKREWESIGKTAGWLKTAATQIIPRKDGKIILLADGLVQHIQTHMKPGAGSVFSKMPDLVGLAQKAPVEGAGGLYPISAGGYELVLPIDKAKQLPDAQETTVQKDERGEKITVPAITTSAPITEFATDQASIVIRQTPAEYIPEDLKANPQVTQAAEQGLLFSVLTAFPGNPDIPPASQWNGKFAVVLPGSQGGSAENRPATQPEEKGL